mmetsp:Transcript_33829/g.70500  ORF Transcript_33829/g.70500 Transcript_33829/m.70500 type:complete len:89 (-) Transcript_33829:21-287(-)
MALHFSIEEEALCNRVHLLAAERALMSIWALLFTGDAHHMATGRHHNDWPNFLTKSTWVSSSNCRSEGIAHALNSSAGKAAGFAKSNC